MRKLRLNLTLCAAALSAVCLLPADAFEVRISNQSSSPAVFAFSYLDKTRGQWVVEGWYNVPAHSAGQVQLNSDHAFYYLYAELENGQAITDPHGLPLSIADGAFFYAQEDGFRGALRTVHFLRSGVQDGQAFVNIN